MTRAALPADLERLLDAVLDASGLDLPERHEVERELRAHFEDGLDAGVPPEELARRFGDAGRAGARIARARLARRKARHTHTGRWWMSGTEWGKEIAQSLRALVRAPGYTAVVILTLALGVGANTAVFTVLDAVLLEPLPYPEPDRLVRVYETQPEDPAYHEYLRGMSARELRNMDDVLAGFGTLYTYRETGADLVVDGHPTRITVGWAGHGYLESLGVKPALGRTFLEDESFGPGEGDDQRPLSAVVVLGHDLWQNAFGGDPSLVGRSISLNGASYEVVGIMPEGFGDPFGAGGDAWIPQDLSAGGSNSWGNFYLSGVARLRDGVTIEAAQSRIDARYAGLRDQEPSVRDWTPALVPLQADLVGDTRRAMLWLLAGAAGLVLLSACVNVANLVFARGLGRVREVAVRAALGSGRTRLIVRSLTENAVLAAAGGLAGVALGTLGVDALLSLAPDAIPMAARPGLSVRVFAFALATSGLALLVFGLAPALRIAATPPADVLRQGSRGSTHGSGMRRLRDGLVVAQIAVGLVLLAGAGLLGRSFLRLQNVPLGVEPEGVLTWEVHLPPARYPDGAARERFHERFRERVAALPGVEAVGASSWLPVNGRYHSWSFKWVPDGDPASGTEEDWWGTDVRVVGGDYFATVGIDVERGQPLEDAEADGPQVVWIGRRIADEVMAGVDPLGQVLRIGGVDRRVVGVVEDVAYDSRGEVSRVVYFPHSQYADDRNWAMIQTARTSRDPISLVPSLRAALAEVDPQLVLYRPRSLEGVLAINRARDTFATALMGAFAGLALLLTAVGTYGVLAGSVATRRREIGIRMALGADRGSVRGMVLRYAATLVAPGVVLGLVGAWIGGRFLQSLLFEVRPADPLVIALTVSVLVGVALVAGWIPARRATRVDPARTLGAE